MIFDDFGYDISDSENMSDFARAAIIESAMYDLLTESELEDFVCSSYETVNAVREGVLLEKSIVRLDKKARYQNYYKAAIFTIAKEKGDRDMKKLMTLWKAERVLEAKLEKKYANEAKKRAKQAMADAKKSKSNIIARIAKKSDKE